MANLNVELDVAVIGSETVTRHLYDTKDLLIAGYNFKFNTCSNLRVSLVSQVLLALGELCSWLPA